MASHTSPTVVATVATVLGVRLHFKSGRALTKSPLRNGEWEYRAFTAEKKPNENVKLTACFECHKPTANHDFVYSYDKLKSAGQ